MRGARFKIVPLRVNECRRWSFIQNSQGDQNRIRIRSTHACSKKIGVCLKPLSFYVDSESFVVNLDSAHFAAVDGVVSELLFDAEELVVFGDAVGAAERAGLDLACVRGHGDVGDGDILSLAGAVADDSGVAVFLGEFDGVERLGERADLVHFDEDRVCHTLVDAFAEEFHIGDEQVVANQLGGRAERVGEFFPADPIVFGAAVLDRDDGVFFAETGVISDELVGAALGSIGLLEDIGLLGGVVELAGGAIEGDEDLLAEFVASGFHGLGDGVQGVLGAGEGRGESAFVADGGGKFATFEFALERMENLGARTKGLREGREVLWHDHELLEINRSIAVRASVKDVHHRHGKDLGVGSAEIFVKGLPNLRGGGLRGCEGNGEDGIGSDFLFGRGAVNRNHGFVDRHLIRRVEADESGSEKFGNISDSFVYALAEIAGFVSVAKLHGLMLSSAGAAGNRCAADGAAGEFDIGFDSRVTARIKDLAGSDGKNSCIGHGVFLDELPRNQLDSPLASSIATMKEDGKEDGGIGLIAGGRGFMVLHTQPLKIHPTYAAI